ncbi:uncharacterized protein J4E88_008288 [Alternaria novae-zelandiae]|uniref:uncharacterized protein n=1 Tax=Alternaria novae-zelandiae TaxID=430562 RepID=UPI0020C306F1|nr:uncharacterized protein J4E88_008288 [Alternaria novae-zelandiae]KAI4674552.1 hypothetical protein J4E88_008288 [Alternaria novae-zelandiae]
MSTLAAQKATAQTVIDGYNAWNMDKIMAYRTEDCTQQVLPASLGRPVMNNTQYRERFSQMIPHFRNFKVTVHTEVHDADAHTCIMHATSTADSDIGPYANEYALVLHFTEDGKQVTKFLEFVDSAFSNKFFKELRDAGLGPQ